MSSPWPPGYSVSPAAVASPAGAVLEDEVAVVAGPAFVGERDLGLRRTLGPDLDLVRRRSDVVHRQRRRERHGQVERRVRDLAFGKVGGGREVLSVRGAALAPGHVVARADDGRKDEAVAPVGGQQQFGIAQFDQHLVAGQDVGDVHLEHVGTVLVEQRCGLAFLLRRLVLELGALLLADRGLQHAFAQPHRHRVHRGLGRAGEDVLRLDRALAFVAVALHHAHIGHRPDDARVDPRALQRQAVDAGYHRLE